MREFGHNGAVVQIQFGDESPSAVCIDSWGSGPFLIIAGGKTFRFEDSDRFGPSLVKKNGAITEGRWPPERSPFWRAHFLWYRQGRRVAGDGLTCLWHEPKPMLYRIEKRRGQNFMIIVEQGEPDGREIDVTGTIDPALGLEGCA